MDRDPRAISAAVANAARAGVAADTDFRCVEAQRAALPEGARGLVVANPPYGRRLRAAERVDAAVVALARRAGWRLALLTPDMRPPGRFGRRLRLSNGGVRVWLHLSG
jgi:putative N6-adenine-specific DNA methylase